MNWLQKASQQEPFPPTYVGLGHRYRWDEKNHSYKELWETQETSNVILWYYKNGKIHEDKGSQVHWVEGDAARGRIEVERNRGSVQFDPHTGTPMQKVILEALIDKYPGIEFGIYERGGPYRLQEYWQKIAQSDDEIAEHYFSVGHGDYSEEHGFEPNYVVWAYLNGRIEMGEEAGIDPETGNENEGGGTHGSLWGHHITDRTYKGRYEPQTGRLSIVKPEGTAKYRDIPDVVMDQLHGTFEIKEVRVF